MNRTIIFLALIALCACNSAVQSQEQKSVKPELQSLSDSVGKVEHTEAEWRTILTPEQYHVLRMKGTDRPFTGPLTFTDEQGTYYCAACGNPLFTSDMKFK